MHLEHHAISAGANQPGAEQAERGDQQNQEAGAVDT